MDTAENFKKSRLSMKKATDNGNESKLANERVRWLDDGKRGKNKSDFYLGTAMGGNPFGKKSQPTSLAASLGALSHRDLSTIKSIGRRGIPNPIAQFEGEGKTRAGMVNPIVNSVTKQSDFMRSLKDSWIGVIPYGLTQNQAYATINSLIKSDGTTNTLRKSRMGAASLLLVDQAIAAQSLSSNSSLTKSFAGASALKYAKASGVDSLNRISSKDFTSHFSRQLVTEAMRGRGYKSKTVNSWLNTVGVSYLTDSDFYVSATPLIKAYDDSDGDEGDTISTSISVAATKDLLSVKTSVHQQLEVTEEELRNLQSYLAESGFFALENPVARRIRDYFLNIKVVPQRIDDVLYHGRSRTLEKQKRAFTKSELENVAPWGVSGVGRFNEANHPLYYTSNDEDTLSKELKVTGKKDDVYDTLKFSIDREMKVLDLSRENHGLLSYCLQRVSSLGNFSMPVEYLIPMFIGACLQRNRDVQVIKIRSAVSPDAINYVFFDSPFGEYVDPGLSEVHANMQGTPVGD